MSILIGIPHIQYCSHCGWKNPLIIKSDRLNITDCPHCYLSLSLKPLSDLSFIEKLVFDLNRLKNNF